MRTIWLCFIVFVIATFGNPARLAGESEWSSDQAASYGDHPMRRVRSTDPTIARLIARAYAQSGTFRQVVDSIEGTDGIVYVQPGRCRFTRACMLHSVTISGSSRLLRILVNPRNAAECDVMSWIGHELWHAWEVLSDPSLTTNADIYFFYREVGRQSHGDDDPPRVLETEAALKAGLDVLTDLRNHRKATGIVCGRAAQEDVNVT
jgi:hypothetical protein